jgi:hypothetical protein
MWQAAITRQVLDEFCTEHNLSVDDEPAMEIAETLLRCIDQSDENPETLRLKLKDSIADRRPDATYASNAF